MEQHIDEYLLCILSYETDFLINPSFDILFLED